VNLSDCTRCSLHKNSMCVGLTGYGSTTTGMTLVVVPGPSTEDDVSNTLMSGRMGISLQSLMDDAGFAKTEWRVTGAIRCVGAPSTSEIDACRFHLKEEILRLKPSVIVAMGDVALRSLCRRAGLGVARGTSLPLHNEFGYACDVYPTYSPAFIQVVPKSRPTVVTDLRRVADRLKEDDHVKYTRQEVDEWSEDGPTSFDIETDFFVTGGEAVVQVGYYSGSTGTARVSGRVPKLVRGHPLIGHNSWGFDVPILRRAGVHVPDLGDDTMVLAYLDDESQPRGLEALCVKYLGVKGWKEGLHAEIGSEEFALYNARDTIHTYNLWRVLCERLGSRKRVHDYIMRPAFEAFRACSERGLYINQTAAHKWEKHYSDERARLYGELANETTIRNPNSSQQVSQYFFGDKKKSSDVAHLLALGTPIAKKVIDARHPGKMLSTFVRPYTALGRIHFPYNILGTDSGRVSARHHNMPRELKSMFGAPPGGCFASVDYAAIEFRFAAWVAGVKNVLDRYAADPNFDPHRWFAGHFYNIPESEVTKEQRQIAKSGNFGLLYKSSAAGLAAYAFKMSGIHMSLRTAVQVRNAWLELLPEIPAFWDRTEAFLREHGYVESVTGRRRNFGDPRLLPRSGGAWNEMVRQGINHMVQSPCTDIAQSALALCHQSGLPINGFFHDSVTFEFSCAEETYRSRSDIQRLMTKDTPAYLKTHFDVDITVPLEVEFTYTYG